MTSKILKQIAIDLSNYEKLQRMGIAGESFNDVLTRLLKYVNHRQGTSFQLSPNDDHRVFPDLKSGVLHG